jgi:osmotically-inducible protein OsmY
VRVHSFLPPRSASAGECRRPVARGPGWWVVVLLLVTASAGCNRQDAECLARIGRKISAHAKSSAGDVGSKLDFGWAGSKKEPTLQEKIQDRLRWESTLTDVTFEVVVKDKEVELKGTVKGALQRQRAIELAETLAGVEKVTDAIVVREAEEAAK